MGTCLVHAVPVAIALAYIPSVLKLCGPHTHAHRFTITCVSAVYDINKSTMREKDHYELVFVRYLYNTHNDIICCLSSVSSEYAQCEVCMRSPAFNVINRGVFANTFHELCMHTALIFALSDSEGWGFFDTQHTPTPTDMQECPALSPV